MPLFSDPTARLLIVLGLAAGASSLAGRALDPLMGVLSAEFAASAATVALLGTAFALPYALVQPVLGPVGDAIGKRRIIRACLLVLTLAQIGCALAPDLATLSVLRVIAGGASGGCFPLAIAVVGDRVPIERRQVALARLLVAGLTGWAGGGILGAGLAPLIGWRGVMAACALAALVALLAQRERDATPPARLNLTEALARYRAILVQPQARELYGAVFSEGMLIFGVFPFVAPLLIARGLGGTAEAGFALFAFALGGFVYGGAAPALLARLGQVRMMKLGGVLGGLGMAALALAPVTAMAVGALLPMGLGFYMVHASIQTRATELAPQARGSAVAMHAFSFFLGQSIGPVAMGVAWSLLGPTVALLGAGAGLVALAVWLAPRGRRRPVR